MLRKKIVEIDEAYIGGRLRHKKLQGGQIVIGMAGRNGRIPLEPMSNRQFEAIKPVLDASTTISGVAPPILCAIRGEHVNHKIEN